MIQGDAQETSVLRQHAPRWLHCKACMWKKDPKISPMERLGILGSWLGFQAVTVSTPALPLPLFLVPDMDRMSRFAQRRRTNARCERNVVLPLAWKLPMHCFDFFYKEP